MIKTTILMGKPGVGKTSFPEYIAGEWKEKRKKTYFLYYLCHEWSTFDEMTYEIDLAKLAKNQGLPPEKHESIYKDQILLKALKLSRRSNVVVVIDELDKAKDKVDTLLLDYIQNGRVTTPEGELFEGKPENIRLFITTNEKRELQDPLLRRGMKYYMTHLPEEVEKDIVLGKNTYYLDLPRTFIKEKYLFDDTDTGEANENILNLLMKIKKRLRESDHDLSVSELRQFYKMALKCKSVDEMMIAIRGWLCRSRDYELALSRQNKNMYVLANNFYRGLS